MNEIHPEMLKALDIVLSWLTPLSSVIWISGTGVVVPILNRRDRRVCFNYRDITLFSLPGKVYSRVGLFEGSGK